MVVLALLGPQVPLVPLVPLAPLALLEHQEPRGLREMLAQLDPLVA